MQINYHQVMPRANAAFSERLRMQLIRLGLPVKQVSLSVMQPFGADIEIELLELAGGRRPTMRLQWMFPLDCLRTEQLVRSLDDFATKCQQAYQTQQKI